MIFCKYLKMSDITAVFYDNSSQKSLVVDWLPKECTEGGPVSIIQLAKEAGLKKVIVISNNFHSFVSLNNNFKAEGLQLIFGLEILMTNNRFDKTEESLASNHKVIVLMKNSQAYYDLIKIYTAWKTNKEAKYYHYRFDQEELKKLWTPNLIMCWPFFDNLVAVNTLINGAAIIPSYGEEIEREMIIFREQDSEHIHQVSIDEALNEFNKDKKFQEMKVKTILYNKREDAKAWITYVSILNQSSFAKPSKDYACSTNFSFQSYKELTTK